MTTALSRADVLVLLYAGMTVFALCCVYAVAEWVFWRAVDRWDGREGCDCTELCSMGPTCPGGALARLPGSGCWRTDPDSAAIVHALAEPDHATCEHADCPVVLCYCGNPDLCDGTEQPQCGHHWFLCTAHAHVDCDDCAVDAAVERDHAYARDEGWS